MKNQTEAQQLHRLTDEELVPLCRTGDSRAFAELMSRYLPVVQFKISRYRFSAPDEEDLQQECWIGFLNAVRRFDSSKNAGFKTFAIVCMQNRLKTAVGRLVRQKQSGEMVPLTEQTENDNFLDLFSSQRSGIEHQVLENDIEHSITARIQSLLSTYEKKVLSLFLSGFSYEEMAKRLGVQLKSIDNCLQRIRKKIKSVVF